MSAYKEYVRIEHFSANGILILEECRDEDWLYHCPDGPAYKSWDDEGNLIEEQWAIHGEPHREDGPAVIKYKNGVAVFMEWWEEGEKVEAPVITCQANTINTTCKKTYGDDGRLVRVEWFNKKGQLHRYEEEGPAVIDYDYRDDTITEQYFLNGQFHRLDGPASVTRKLATYKQESCNSLHTGILSEDWFLFGMLHNENGPAIRQWNSDGLLIVESWLQEGVYTRKDGPAFMAWNDAGKLIYEEWFLNGILHREDNDGPTYTICDADGMKITEGWLKNGFFHNETGPAVKMYKDGQLTVEYWWENGIRKKDKYHQEQY